MQECLTATLYSAWALHSMNSS